MDTEYLLEFLQAIVKEPYPDSDLKSLLKTYQTQAEKILSEVKECGPPCRQISNGHKEGCYYNVNGKCSCSINEDN